MGISTCGTYTLDDMIPRANKVLTFSTPRMTGMLPLLFQGGPCCQLIVAIDKGTMTRVPIGVVTRCAGTAHSEIQGIAPSSASYMERKGVII